ncbi:MAG: hypothetical protein ACMUIG_07875 [Thermoplasmatota archaeon]
MDEERSAEERTDDDRNLFKIIFGWVLFVIGIALFSFSSLILFGYLALEIFISMIVRNPDAAVVSGEHMILPFFSLTIGFIIAIFSYTALISGRNPSNRSKAAGSLYADEVERERKLTEECDKLISSMNVKDTGTE